VTDPKALFDKAWRDEVNKRKAESPSVPFEQYTATGRSSAKYPNKEDASWWADNGPGMVEKFIEWRNATRWDIWETPDGQNGIELEIRVELPQSKIPLLMFLDRVYVTPVGQLTVVDLKTGRTPDISEQLGFYATGIELKYGPEFRPQWGFWYDARKGEVSKPMSLDFWTPAVVEARALEVVAAINAGSFPARPANGCERWCSSRQFCAIVGGPKAHLHDPLLQIQS